MNPGIARITAVTSAAVTVACWAAVIACGTTHPVRAAAAAGAGIVAAAVFLAAWRMSGRRP